MARVVVIGDVGGHAAQLHQALVHIGASGSRLRLPPDTVVVQVGDLIDRGPDSHGVLALVRDLLDDHPDQWVQLAGNHEAQYLGQERFWPQPLDAADADLLRTWWTERRLHVAAALRTAEGDEFLVTHAGLTRAAWAELGEPMTATAAADALNQRPEPLLWRGGAGVIDRGAGPLWAEAGWELHEPWLLYHHEGGFVPFGQIHGHSAIVAYADQTFRCPERVRLRANVDWAARQVRVRVGGREFIGVDPKHGRHGAPQWTPLVLDNAALGVPVG
jgi:hypothetical protein